jgi:excisionase family DNA binding protein
MYTAKEVAAILGISVKTVRKLRLIDQSPPYVRIGKKLIRYPKDEFCKWKETLRT